ncbi:MAG: hypothetical protein US46_C0007G0030, partial [Candidatus Shapirobacteria bacterium GW2011_GWF2_37_20]
MNQVKEIFNQTLFVKEKFKKIETKEWSTKEFGTELMVQTGHLSDILLRQGFKHNPYNIDENNKHLGDEMSDILLNTFSIIDTTGISPESLTRSIQNEISSGTLVESLDWKQVGDFGIEQSRQESPEKPIDQSLFEKIIKHSSEMFFLTRNEELVLEDILNTATKLTINTFALGKYMELNLPGYFDKMTVESEAFVDQKYLKNIESYPYKVAPINLVIEESALPFLEKPPAIKLPNVEPLPFLLLRSSGLSWADFTREKIQEGGFSIDHEREVTDFEVLARHLYPAFADKEETYLWFLISRKAFPENYNIGHAFVLSEKDAERYAEIDSLKRKIRS